MPHQAATEVVEGPSASSHPTQPALTNGAPLPALWPASKVRKRKVASLRASPRNVKQHPPEQIALLVESMRQFGVTFPVLVDETGEIIAGEGRWLAAQRLGLSEIPVVVASGWTDGQKRSYRVADNTIPLSGPIDWPRLKLEVGELQLLQFPIEPLGFLALPLDGALPPAQPVAKPPKTKGTIFVTVATERMEEARSIIAGALHKAGIDSNL